MNYIINIATDNAAFEDTGPELARILRKLADGLDDGRIAPTEDHPLRDLNGNTVGSAGAR